MRIQPVFYTNLLRPATDDPLPGQKHPPPPPVEVDGGEEFEVKEVIDSRSERRGRGRLSSTAQSETSVSLGGWEDPAELRASGSCSTRSRACGGVWPLYD
ncbi:uncharacterized protein F5Z01DRAFT_669115 [Emericellopsis atlantica]|uniref:Uncharacterized protein n=1 Tax=Emericellopsis atlantica TaxID=2614577 RepID=A0A9P7ZD36_9HYPO|nr:uncharacterized protein F5Z01DRAFT_669115 [Emericellopsis atlantica]KAG9249467.1 hypothetical protein F5Z01DRAFT_669115 [Emericellopsis atlantica]